MKKRNLIMLAALFTFAIGIASVHAKTNSEIKSEDLDLFTTIEANVDTSDIKIVKGDKCKIEINYRRPEEKISYNVKNNTLMITGKRSWNIFSWFGSKKYNVITVYAPKIDSAKLNAKSGDIVVDSFDMNELSTNASSGDVKIENSNTQKVIVDTTSGDINVQNSKLHDSNVNTNSGDINISNTQMENMDVIAHSGDINIELIEQANLKLKAGSGTIKVDGKSYEREYTESNSSKNNINAEVSSGDIRITHK